MLTYLALQLVSTNNNWSAVCTVIILIMGPYHDLTLPHKLKGLVDVECDVMLY